jgi:hypothetical protein
LRSHDLSNCHAAINVGVDETQEAQQRLLLLVLRKHVSKVLQLASPHHCAPRQLATRQRVVRVDTETQGGGGWRGRRGEISSVAAHNEPHLCGPKQPQQLLALARKRRDAPHQRGQRVGKRSHT